MKQTLNYLFTRKQFIFFICFTIICTTEVFSQANFTGYTLTNFVNHVITRPLTHQFADASFITNPALNTGWLNIGYMDTENSGEKLLLTWDTAFFDGAGDDIIIVNHGRTGFQIASGTARVRLLLTDDSYTDTLKVDFAEDPLVSTLPPPYSYYCYDYGWNLPFINDEGYAPEGKRLDISDFYNGPLAVKGIEFSVFTNNWLDLKGVAGTQNAIKVLPVKLSYFRGNVVNGKPLLYWRTESAINAGHFVIERSADGVNFITVGEIKIINSNSAGIDYAYTDNEALSNGNYFYRLKMVDLDGKFTRSETIKLIIKKSKQPDIVITYRSTGNQISFTGAIVGSKYCLVNCAGQVVFNGTVNSLETYLPANKFSHGLYFIKIDGMNTKKLLL